MERNKRDEGSHYVNRPEDREEELQAERVIEQPVQKKSRAATVLAVLLLLAIAGAAYAGWMLNQETARANAADDELAVVNEQLSDLKATNAKLVADAKESTISTKTTNDDSEAIIATALAYESANANPLTGLKAQVAYYKGDFAKVNITSNTVGHYQILKKSNDLWLVVASGNGPLPQETIEQYAIPAAALK